MKHALLGLAILAVPPTGCGGDTAVPARPTWVEHVEPLLRGSCFHCHGAGGRPSGALRWDVFDVAAPTVRAVGAFGGIVSANDPGHFAVILSLARLSTESRMPPPPALPLTARDLELLERWRDNGFERGERRPNRKPEVRIVSRDESRVILEVSDADRDQVLGRVVANREERLIDRTGAHVLDLGATAGPLEVTLTDGQEQVSTTLGRE